MASKWANDECETRDIDDYNEWCNVHNQDAHLCHFLPWRIPVKADNRRIKVKVRVIL